jgi:hypothetical protein
MNILTGSIGYTFTYLAFSFIRIPPDQRPREWLSLARELSAPCLDLIMIKIQTSRRKLTAVSNEEPVDIYPCRSAFLFPTPKM